MGCLADRLDLSLAGSIAGNEILTQTKRGLNMASAKKKPQSGAQLTPTTMALMAMTLLVGIIIGIIIGRGMTDRPDTPIKQAGTTTQSVARADKPTPPGQRAPAKASASPFLDIAATDKFKDNPDDLSDYRRAVDFVDRRNARAATPILDRLAASNPEAAYQEEVSLLLAANKVNQNLPQEALDAVTDWRHSYPDSRLKAQAALTEGKAYIVKGRALAGGQEPPTGAAKETYEQARDAFLDIPKTFPDDTQACGEALYNLGSVYGNLGETDKSLKTYDDLVDKHPEHPLAARALYQVANSSWSGEDYERATQYFQKLLDRYPDNSLSKRARKNINALGIIGQDAPEIVVDHWINGTGTTLQASKGKVVMLNFWNEWCPHCRRELPKLSQLQAKYADQGLVIIPITKHTKNQTDDKIASFLDKHGIDLPCAVEPEGYQSTRDFGVSGVPASAIVGRDGKIIWRNHPARLTEARLEELLAQ